MMNNFLLISGFMFYAVSFIFAMCGVATLIYKLIFERK